MVATDRTISQPTSPGIGQPTPDVRGHEIVLVEIAKIQNDGEYIKRDLGELRTDMRDLRDRMAKLEVRVDHLPSKEFIVVVVTVALTIAGALLTVAPKLQSWAGMTPTPVIAPLGPGGR